MKIDNLFIYHIISYHIIIILLITILIIDERNIIMFGLTSWSYSRYAEEPPRLHKEAGFWKEFKIVFFLLYISVFNKTL